ncbi:MAG TPA: hypothetical protein ENN17_05535 [bacterium]|nr:hypothetical protein [bacterium]
MNRRSIVSIVLVVFHAALFGQGPGQWVACSGEAAVQNITTEEAQALALRRARHDAVERVCGVLLQSETLVKDFMTAGDFIHTISYGEVVEEKDVQWETETLPSDRPGSPPVIVLRVSMNARVVSREGKPDPSFRISLKLNKTSFQSGEEAIIRV